MRVENVEQFWYAFWFTRGVILLILLWVVALFSKWLLRGILWNRNKRRPVKHSMVHSFGTFGPARNFNASEHKVVDRSPQREKEARWITDSTDRAQYKLRSRQ
jgi:hypothetical protein